MQPQGCVAYDGLEEKVTRIVSDSCTCGMMMRSIEEQTLNTVLGRVQKVLKTSSDVLVARYDFPLLFFPCFSVLNCPIPIWDSAGY